MKHYHYQETRPGGSPRTLDVYEDKAFAMDALAEDFAKLLWCSDSVQHVASYELGSEDFPISEYTDGAGFYSIVGYEPEIIVTDDEIAAGMERCDYDGTQWEIVQMTYQMTEGETADWFAAGDWHKEQGVTAMSTDEEIAALVAEIVAECLSDHDAQLDDDTVREMLDQLREDLAAASLDRSH